MNDDIAIRVQDITKTFKDQTSATTLKHSFIELGRKLVGKQSKNKKSGYTALKDINFEVKKGEFFGIVGRNGSGKSTLLKIIAGVYNPTKGAVTVNGTLTPFIELGVGFNPELSGKDNVYLNAALLGFTRKETDEMYEDIVDFAELEEFMDMKLKNYSSGMQVRLAFSIAIRSDSETILLDEVLAVGDEAFQRKCLQQFNIFKSEAKTIILVSHSMEMIQKFCDRTMLVNSGTIDYIGDTEEAVSRYQGLNLEKKTRKKPEKNQKKTRFINIRSVNISSGLKSQRIFRPLEDFEININLKSNINIKNAFIALKICDAENRGIIISTNNIDENFILNLNAGDNNINLSIHNSPIIKGSYYILFGIYNNQKREEVFAYYNGFDEQNYFMVKNNDDVGLIDANISWSQDATKSNQ